MARSYVYRLAHTQTVSAAGVAEITIPGAGRIIGFHASQIAVGGAGWGTYRNEIALNNNGVVNAAVNYPPRNQTVGSWSLGFPNTNPGWVDTGYVPTDIPVQSGDRISINNTATGTAATNQYTVVDVYFVDGK